MTHYPSSSDSKIPFPNDPSDSTGERPADDVVILPDEGTFSDTLHSAEDVHSAENVQTPEKMGFESENLVEIELDTTDEPHERGDSTTALPAIDVRSIEAEMVSNEPDPITPTGNWVGNTPIHPVESAAQPIEELPIPSTAAGVDEESRDRPATTSESRPFATVVESSAGSPIELERAEEPQFAPATWVADVSPTMVEKQSWVFRFIGWLTSAAEWTLGVGTLIVLLAVVSAIPIIQILTFGYLLECARRVTQTGKFWSGVVGARKAARIGSVAVGTWLCLLPVQYLSSVWYASNLIAPDSLQTQILRGLQIFFAVTLIGHVLAAWYCGGRLRHFFWPVVAPFSLMLWAARKMADTASLRPILRQAVGWISPHLVDDIGRAKPLTDWFLPAVLLKGLVKGKLYSDARDGIWDFFAGLHLPQMFWLGLRGFAGTVAWVFLPTLLLIGISVLPEGPAVISALVGAFALAVVMIYVPFAQASFAYTGKLYALFDLGAMRKAFCGAPFLHALSLFLLLGLALPLYLFKIERIPNELLWMPGVFFMMISWPTRMLVAWSFAKGIKREKPRIWAVRWPMRMMLFPISMAFVFFVLLTPYLTWNGSLGLFEHHSVLVPAPFFEWPF